MIESLRAFVVGGAIVMGTVYMTKHFSPLIGSLFWSYPISLIVTLVILNETERVETINSLSYISILGPIFISLWSILIRFAFNFWQAGLIASIVWFLLSLVVYKLSKHIDLFI